MPPPTAAILVKAGSLSSIDYAQQKKIEKKTLVCTLVFYYFHFLTLPRVQLL